MGVKIDAGSKLELRELHEKIKNKNNEKDLNKGSKKDQAKEYAKEFGFLLDSLRESLANEVKLFMVEMMFEDMRQ